MERSSLQTRRERLSQLAPRVGPVALARDRVMAVAPALQPLLPDAGLVRGSVVGCQGPTAISVALAAVSAASAAGSWLACVGVPVLGLRAAAEAGVALERLVLVEDPADLDEQAWANMMSALIDGFDLVVLRSTRRIPAGTARRLQARLQARGAVLLIVGQPGSFSCDVTITGMHVAWEGLGDGSGRLVRRLLTLSATGRRSPRPRRVDVWLPGADGGVETAGAVVSVSGDATPGESDDRDRRATAAFRPTG